jgi:hypothetical protein
MPIEACVAGCGCRGAAHHTGRRRTTPQDQLKTLVHWACWTVRQQLTLRRYQAGPKPRLGSLSSALSVRGHALAMPLVLVNNHSKSQEFGGLQPRDERSRNPSLGLPRVGGEPHRGRPVHQTTCVCPSAAKQFPAGLRLPIGCTTIQTGHYNGSCIVPRRSRG